MPAIWEQEQPGIVSGSIGETEEGKEGDTTIGLCIPHQNTVSMAWALAFRHLQLPNTRYFLNRGLPIDVARQQITESALEHNPEYLFFMDSDNYSSANSVRQLMAISREHDLDIVSGLYFAKKRDKNHPCAWKLVETRAEGKGSFAPVKIQEHVQRGNIVQCDVAGMGYCLVKADVFHALKQSKPNQPFFEWGLGRQGKRQVSEDFYFFLRCVEELDIYPHVATSIPVKHVCQAEKQGVDGELKLTEA